MDFPSEAKLSVLPVYQHVIDEVIQELQLSGDENIDGEVLKDLKETWEAKLSESNAVTVRDVATMPSTSNQSGASTSRQDFPQPQPQLQQTPAVIQPIANICPITPVDPADPVASGSNDSEKMISLRIQFPGQVREDGEDPELIIQVPASAFQGNPLSRNRPLVLPDAVIRNSMTLPKDLARSILEEHVIAALKGQHPFLILTAEDAASTM